MVRRHAVQRNAELAKYRAKGILAKQPTAADKLIRFFCQLLVLAVWKSLGALSVPFGKLFALYFWMGKSVITLSLFVEKQLLKAVGWLSGTGFGRDSRVGRVSHHYFGVDVKRWHVGVVAIVLGGMVHAVAHSIRSQFDERAKHARVLRRLMGAAPTYEQWREYAEQLEMLEGEDKASHRNAAMYEDYDRRLLLEKARHLKKIAATRNAKEIMFGLRIDLIRNIANIAKSQKHRQNFVSVPEPIKQYIKEVQEQLQAVADWPEHELSLDDKLSFFRITRHTFGRTALLLSGGGGLGTFHLGVCKALFERRMLPRVLAGSSVGSIVCAVMGTRTDAELKRTFDRLDKFDISFFQNSRTMDLVRYALNKGHLQEITFMVSKLRTLLGDCTFMEAYERTGRILNVTVCPADTNEPPRLLNYMTAPQALVWSAVAASSSFPGLYPPQHLLGRNSKGEVIKLHGHGGSEALQRRWRDGSLEFDLPVQALGEMFNCNHYLVSQTNPHIVPLLNFKSIFPHKWASIMEAELKHRLQVLQWMLPEWRVSKALTLFTQPWEGDITFTLPSALWNISKTIVNPSTEDLMRSVRVGEIATWERMSAIQCNCTIEATLDKCVSKLQTALTVNSAQRVAGLGSKIPSWFHLPPTAGLSHPTVHSWGDNEAADGDVAANASWGDFTSMCNNATSRIHLPPLYQPMHGVLSDEGGSSGMLCGGTLGTASVPDFMTDTVAPPAARYSANGDITHSASGSMAPTGRLPPIASSRSSADEDGFDSASSVAARRGMMANSGSSASGGLAGRGGLSMGKLSRHSSVIANLSVLGEDGLIVGAGGPVLTRAGPLRVNPGSAGGGGSVRSGGSSVADHPPSSGAAGSGSPAESNRSSFSLADTALGSGGGAAAAAPGTPQVPRPPRHSGGGAGAGALLQRVEQQHHGSRPVQCSAASLEHGQAACHQDAEETAHPQQQAPHAAPVGGMRRGGSTSSSIQHADAAATPNSTAASASSTHANSAPGSRQQQQRTSASGHSSRSSTPHRKRQPQHQLTEEQLLALARMDCPPAGDGELEDIWASLLPLAGTCETLVTAHAVARNGGALPTAQMMDAAVADSEGDAIDIFAY